MPMPSEVKPFDDDTNYKMVEFARESRDYLYGQVQSHFSKVVGFWEKYYSKRADPRDPLTEKWRSHIVVPQTYYNTEAKTAQMLEIVMSADPPIQADPVFETQEDNSKGIQDLLNYTLSINYFRKWLAGAFRSASIQGTEFFKVVWKKRTVMVPRRLTPAQLSDFQKRLQEASQLTGLQPGQFPDWMTDKQGFEAWRDLVNKSFPSLHLPSAPNLSGEPELQYTFWGPYIERIPIWQVLLNPEVGEIEDQPIVIHEMFKPRAWLNSMTGADPTKPFDPVRVEKAMAAWSPDMTSAEQQELSNKLGIPVGVQKNPMYQEPVLVQEVWRLNSEYPFQVILNREQVINKDPRVLPYEHGGIPIGHIRNVMVPGYAYGVSDVEPAMSLLEEQDIFRSLRLDKATLHTLPVFKKLSGFNISELQKKLSPGGIIEVSRLDGIAELLPGDINPGAFQESSQISLDIDRAWGIGDNVRGGSVSVNRVSATESSQRLTQALTRTKLSAIQFEDDFNPKVGQILGLWRQFGNPESRPTVGGYDPMADIDPDKLQVALSQNYRFRGATQALNRELQGQQLIMFGKEFRDMLLPTEMRVLMRQVGLALGLRSLTKIVSPEGDKMMMESFLAQKQAEASQNQAAQVTNEQVTATAEAPREVEID